ncbi:hypothetical protein PCANC_27532 [Puccinia coronata f. sp. avenae]|uniref:DNA 3'-5' helicase n=1 Tax=Puccinia coronata f. sp. avenae TaxID=200324 RepID=A0A2N5TGS8_9BASI|nr:hypothetical protein PCANC_27532 [Puccinia coronata f. sp. avenae]
MTAINLTKLTFNSNEAAKICQGAYQFVYLSPEIVLNSKMWDTVYFSQSFQDRLALVVVDEAHMIYQWGIVESTKGKQVQSLALGKHEDWGVFRPSYGKLGIHLLARESVPLLLMSATCRPVAVREIKKSLKIDTSNLVMLHGELTRPEICIIRVTMRCSLGSANDLLSIYPPKTQTPDNLLARQSPELVRSATSTFARRFHSCTGKSDKIKAVQDFADGIFPVCSCTMAFGMGQNWSRVRSVVHMGRGEPSAVCQMIGRCGRDGRPGLAVLFVEKTRKNGKNKLADFDASASDEQNEDDCMDALAITPVCLRIALAINNKLGYIPLCISDEGYIQEKIREAQMGLPLCQCSNCLPDKATWLMSCIKKINTLNMDDYVLRGDASTLPDPTLLALQRNLKQAPDGTDQPIQRKRSTAAAKASASLIDPNLLHIL